MAKKSARPPAEVVAATPESAPAAVQQTPTESTPVGDDNGQKRPLLSWKFPAPAGVTIEVVLWPAEITLASGEKMEVYQANIIRRYKDTTGAWQTGGSFRIAELPILLHAITRAHAWALDARELSCPI